MIIRNKPTKDFTVLRNQPLQSTDLSLKAKGLWAFLMTKPDGWQVSIRGLQTQLKEGKDSVMGALQELEAAGLYRKIKKQNAAGHFVYEDFVYDSPHTENPRPGNPHADNPPQVKTNEVKTEIVKTDEDSMRLASQLAEAVHANYNFAKVEPHKWAKDIEKLHRIDGYDYKLIEAVITWSQQDDFWRQNIRSGVKLRKQFETLLIRIKAEQQKKRGNFINVDDEIAMEEQQ